MRSVELRIIMLLVLCTCTAVGAAYWLATAGHDPAAPPPMVAARLAVAVVGTGLCAWLSVVALRRHWLEHDKQLLGEVQALIIAKDITPLPSVRSAGDRALVAPFTTSLRDHFTRQQGQIDQLQMQRKDLEIQVRLADIQRRQSETLIFGISDAVLVTNVFDELVLANPAAADLFHFDLAKSTRRPVRELVREEKLASDMSDMRQNSRRTNRRTTEMTLERGGQPHTFIVTFSCVTDSRDELTGVVTVFHDVTREKEVAKMKSDFVSHVSHELRTPLSSIKAYAEMLVDGEATDDKTRDEFYHIIQGEADRLSRLIDNILNISRIEAGVVRVSRKPVPLTGILKEVLEVAMPSAREKSITLNAQLSPVFFQVEVDRDMIYQAALNLVSNAIKYTPPNGTVTVKTSVNEQEHKVQVEVIDTGVGIPPEAMGNLFEKFFRVEQHKNMAKGSGLGLNLSRQIIEVVHKGTMHVTSVVGKGSNFSFALPIIE